MKATKQQVLDAVESLGTAMATFSLIACGVIGIGISSQADWTVPGFVIPQWLVTCFFATAIVGAAVRIFSKPIVNIAELFIDFGVTPPVAHPTEDTSVVALKNEATPKP